MHEIIFTHAVHEINDLYGIYSGNLLGSEGGGGGGGFLTVC